MELVSCGLLFNRLRRCFDSPAAGVYLHEGCHPIIPIIPCIHAVMQPLMTNDQ
jgi:hypothetical protein